MSDTNTKTTSTIPIRPLEKKNEQGIVTASITPVLEVAKRGAYEGNPFVTINVTKENFPDYVKFRGEDAIIEILNAKERIDALEALNWVAVQQDAENEAAGKDEDIFIDANAGLPEDKKPKSKTGEILEKWIIDFTKLNIDKLYQTLLEGKVRGGLTIKVIEEEMLPDLLTQMKEAIQKGTSAAGMDEKIKWFTKSQELSIQHQNLEAEAARIRADRKPRAPRKAKVVAVAAPVVASAVQS